MNTLPVYRRPVLAISFTPDGKQLISAGDDGEVGIDPLAIEDLIDQAQKWAARHKLSLSSKDCKDYLIHSNHCDALEEVEDGQKEARDNKLSAAIRKLKNAKQLDPSLNFDPEQTVVRVLLDQGRSLARNGDIAGAVERFREAKSLNPSLSIDPAAEAKRIRAQALLGQGRSLAESGDIAGAVERFREAKSLNPSLSIDPQTEPRRYLAVMHALKLLGAMRVGKVGKDKVREVLAAFAEAQKLDAKAIDAESWNSLCWEGSLLGHAHEVMGACEEAVRLGKGNSHIRDSRGLARALLGDRRGAIVDFEAYVKEADPDRKLQRQAWIAALRQDKNPFTPDVLQTLLGP